MEPIIVLLLFLLFICFVNIKIMKSDIEDKENTIKLLTGKMANMSVRLTIMENIKFTNNRKANNNPQILEAVKYAMKNSHPDNGGNAEDFKKFRDLYNNMK